MYCPVLGAVPNLFKPRIYWNCNRPLSFSIKKYGMQFIFWKKPYDSPYSVLIQWQCDGAVSSLSFSPVNINPLGKYWFTILRLQNIILRAQAASSSPISSTFPLRWNISWEDHFTVPFCRDILGTRHFKGALVFAFLQTQWNASKDVVFSKSMISCLHSSPLSHRKLFICVVLILEGKGKCTKLGISYRVALLSTSSYSFSPCAFQCAPEEFKGKIISIWFIQVNVWKIT